MVNPSTPRRLRFTKMQGAGNDFVVIDATRTPFALDTAAMRRLGDRRFGVGADQILVIEPPRKTGMDFAYRIFNNTGDEVEHCGNGARCFARFVRERGLAARDTIRVETMNNELELAIQPDGRVRVDMNAPRLEHAQLPFDGAGLRPRAEGRAEFWPLDLGEGLSCEVAVLSLGNPHAVQRVDDVDRFPVGEIGPLVETHPGFPRRVNAGFLQVVSRSHVKLRVFERDAGETLACGTGACAAVVAGILAGWLDTRVDVDARGGRLTVEWGGGAGDSVFLTGPAAIVFEGEIEL